MDSVKEFKIVTLGEGRVGKTSLTLKFARNEFHDNEISTVQANFIQKDVDLGEGAVVRLNIWDTAGQERFRALAPNYYRQANGAVIAYDITDSASFIRVKTWVKELQSQADKDICIVIAGNKCDRESERQITAQEAIEYSQSIGASHFNTSAKSGKGVQEIYAEIARKVYAVHLKNSKSAVPASNSRSARRVKITTENKEGPKNSKCC
jgi:Ras-related protein Rab-21